MTRLLASGFLIAHGGLHAAIWVSPRQRGAPFDASHSWVFGNVRPIAILLAVVAAIAFVAAGAGYFGGQEWWALSAAAGAVVSIGLLALTFSPWWLAALAINVTILFVAWPTFVGALR